MKKIFLVFAGFVFSLGIAFSVSASEAKCVYCDPTEYDCEFEYTVQIGKNSLTTSTTKSEHEVTKEKYYLNPGNLNIGNFIEDDKYFCREKLYYNINSGTKNGESYYNIVLQVSESNSLGELKLDKTKSVVVNDEVVHNHDVPENEREESNPDEEANDEKIDAGFFGPLEVIKCGNTEIPEPIPPITRVIVLFIKIAAPFVLIIMGMIDIVKAVTANDEKKMKEAQTNFIKRLIPAALIFLTVTIMQLLVGILADNSDDSTSLSNCIDCMISDESKCDTN